MKNITGCDRALPDDLTTYDADRIRDISSTAAARGGWGWKDERDQQIDEYLRRNGYNGK